MLVNIFQLKKSFAARPLFEKLTFAIEKGERIGLIGPNGVGKSTLLRIIAGLDQADEGTISFERGLRIAYLEQIPKFNLNANATIESSIMEGAGDVHDWQDQAKAEELISKLSISYEKSGLDIKTPIVQLSGGWKKRVALARELLKHPDILLLDEPTNHLDVESIIWLEEMLARAPFATLTVTHDRLFLQKVSNRIIELDPKNPGGLLSVNGDYLDYLKLKEEIIATSERQEIKLKNTLRRETEWLLRGAKARTTKQQARIERAEELQKSVEEISARNVNAKVRIDFQLAEKNPKKLIEAVGICKSYNNKLVIPPIDILITRKSRIGLLGVNGCGKTTLIRLLLDQESSDGGKLVHAEKLQVAWFEQNRDSLDPNLSILKTVCPNGDHVDYHGGKVHIKSYLSRFLFNQQQMEMPVGKLSGGEQGRVMIALLMLKPANMLVLDEPTNDLDMATLEILQEVLKEFEGAVILVTHDRYFLDQVTEQIYAFEKNSHGQKEIMKFYGLEQWQSWRDSSPSLSSSSAADPASNTPSSSSNTNSNTNINPNINPNEKKKKLSFKEQRELQSMESTILEKESNLKKLTEESNDPKTISNGRRLSEIAIEMQKLQEEIDKLYARWAELE
ncbi:MAG: ABC-F family ATP-binding cassette domain-containing protein [Oligoflexia bacterium]|nr:ABC-F family ATP-binding cassette domain-containing protein [Oligoflexia bacterium]